MIIHYDGSILEVYMFLSAKASVTVGVVYIICCSICHEYQLCENHALFNRDHDDSHLLIKIKTPGVCDRTPQHENEVKIRQPRNQARSLV